MTRSATINRKTHETEISVKLDLDGTGQAQINTGVGFFDHMITHLSKHGRFDLTVQARGDLQVDQHHTVEDVGICLGQALDEALGGKLGIQRFGFASVPMDESLANVSVDLSGRPWLAYNVQYPTDKVGQFDTELIEEFLRAFSNHGKLNLHVNVLYGTNSHHTAEAIFKSLAVALSAATMVIDASGEVPSTKGKL